MKTILGNNLLYQSLDVNFNQQLMQILDLPPIIAEVLSKIQGITLQNADSFVNPKLKTLLPDPKILKNMDIAVTHICDAIINGKKIGILGDYDVDGVCSSSMLAIFLSLLGLKPIIIVPDRFKHGYGPSVALFDEMHAQGVDTIITLDCGTVAFAPIEHANSLGMHVVVVDHHISQTSVPKAIAVVNPNQVGDTSGLGYLCAAGVTFLLCIAVNKALRELGYYRQIQEPNVIMLSSFAAIATVCDMMRMVGLNRALYHTGVDVLNRAMENFDSLLPQERMIFQGIRELLISCKLPKIKSTYDIGFIIGPTINAGGRIASAMVGIEMLTSESPENSALLAAKLRELNQERKDIQLDIVESAKIKADMEIKSGKNVIFITSEAWHEGVIGIVASKIKDIYNKPTIIGAISEHGEGEFVIKASCRSIDGVDIGSCVMAALDEGLLLKGGGHAGAAGFSCLVDKKDDLYAFFEHKLHEAVIHASAMRKLEVASCFTLDLVNNRFAELKKLEPFGISNPKPLFMIKNVVIASFTLVKDIHYRLSLRNDAKDAMGKYVWQNAILFNAQGSILGDYIRANIGKVVSLICSIDFGDYGLSINVVDILPN